MIIYHFIDHVTLIVCIFSSLVSTVGNKIDPGIMNLSGNSPGPGCLGLPGPYLKVQLLLLTPAPTGGDTSPASGSETQNITSQ